jgi:hypothetical protein
VRHEREKGRKGERVRGREGECGIEFLVII